MFDPRKRPMKRLGMSNPLPIPAEHGVCKHCEQDIIRWPNVEPFSKRWIHNPRTGFRLHRCEGHATVAEPK